MNANITNQKKIVMDTEFISTEKYFSDGIANSENMKTVDMAFHAGAEWFTSIGKNDLFYAIFEKGIRLKVLLNVPDKSEVMAKHMRHKRKRYIEFEECI